MSATQEEEDGTRPAAPSPVKQIKVQFLAVGNAPILKKAKFQVRETMTVGEVLLFIRKLTKVPESDPIFLYINSSFAPGLDQTLASLFASFQVNNELLLQFAITNSWG